MTSLDKFGPVWCASGSRGWFGEGYWFHRFVPGLDWSGSTFVAKTTTLEARKGNMPLKRDWTPLGLFPKCVVVYPWKGHALNAVGLSGPGAEVLLADGGWQERTEPFFLSFMAVGATKEDRFEEAKTFSRLLRSHLDGLKSRYGAEFNAPVGLQVNLSCPNTGHDPDELVDEAAEFLDYVGEWLPAGVPIVAKLNVLFPVAAAARLGAFCNGICVSNTIPWGTLGDKIDWWGLFHPHGMTGAAAEPLWEEDPGPFSPLAHLGGGGLSGAPLLPLVADWIERVHQAGFDRHVNACGGILRPKDVDVLVEAGADSISLGTIAMLRGWRLRRTIARARRLLG